MFVKVCVKSVVVGLVAAVTPQAGGMPPQGVQGRGGRPQEASSGPAAPSPAGGVLPPGVQGCGGSPPGSSAGSATPGSGATTGRNYSILLKVHLYSLFCFLVPSSSSSGSNIPAVSSSSEVERVVDSERPKTPRQDEDSQEPSLSEYEKAWRLISSAPASTRRRLMGPVSTSTPQNSSTSPQASNSLENLTMSTDGEFV